MPDSRTLEVGKREAMRFFPIVSCVCVCVCARARTHTHMHACTQSCLTLCNTMDCSPLVPLSMEVFRQEYWSRLSFPTPGDLPNPETEPSSLVSAALAG